MDQMDAMEVRQASVQMGVQRGFWAQVRLNVTTALIVMFIVWFITEVIF